MLNERIKDTIWVTLRLGLGTNPCKFNVFNMIGRCAARKITVLNKGRDLIKVHLDRYPPFEKDRNLAFNP